MPNLKPVANRQFIAVIDGVQVSIQKVSAPKVSLMSDKYNDGVTGVERTHLSFISYDNVTLTCLYDPTTAENLFDWVLGAIKDSKTFTVTIQPVQSDLEGSPLGAAKSLQLLGCQVASYKHPEMDRSGSGLAMMEVEVAVESIAKQ